MYLASTVLAGICPNYPRPGWELVTDRAPLDPRRLKYSHHNTDYSPTDLLHTTYLPRYVGRYTYPNLRTASDCITVRFSTHAQYRSPKDARLSRLPASISTSFFPSIHVQYSSLPPSQHTSSPSFLPSLLPSCLVFSQIFLSSPLPYLHLHLYIRSLDLSSPISFAISSPTTLPYAPSLPFLHLAKLPTSHILACDSSVAFLQEYH